MTAAPHIVIVGAGLTAASAIEAMRGEGFGGAITLIGEEIHLPYLRPPLSKGYLQGADARESVFVHDREWYADRDVELALGVAAIGLDREMRLVSLADGTSVHYDALLLATGARPRHLSIPGVDGPGVLQLRTLDDSDRLRTAFSAARSVAIVGAGWIGLETAAAARAAGPDVTIIEVGRMPLERVVGAEVAPFFADLHRSHGVDLRFDAHVAAVQRTAGTVTGVRLRSGEEIPADLVVVGVGAMPNIALAEDSGLEVFNGIVADSHLLTTDNDIYAAGDAANAYNVRLRRRVRVEHWANARRQGAVAGLNLIGRDASNDDLPFFYSDQYDMGLEYTGYADDGQPTSVQIRGDMSQGAFIAFWIRDERVVAGMNVNTWDVADDIARLIDSHAPVDVRRLTDPDFPLAEVLGPATSLASGM